ncbi:hypothetical protein [Herbaspirillum rhizosphaerae]|uniref:hypothetical protein n=1 Tax=Herbaspirillum rhizosphaerae TaxID=346179 RepID=UPI00067AC3C1|nr:hypothetical protein [Herbaspirillum rhizosphaerae]
MIAEHKNFALSTEGNVQELAQRITALAHEIHTTLRRLSVSNNPLVYALLTEEYALNARAHILFFDSKRFVISDWHFEHDELLNFLSALGEKLKNIETIDQLEKLIAGLTLFSNSIISKNVRTISFLFKELRDVVS